MSRVNGHKPVFKALSSDDLIQMTVLADEAFHALQQEYPAVFAKREEGEPEPPMAATVSLKIRIQTQLIPPVHVAWEGDAPSVADLLALPYATLLDYCRQVRKVNPFLLELPEPEADPTTAPASPEPK